MHGPRQLDAGRAFEDGDQLVQLGVGCVVGEEVGFVHHQDAAQIAALLGGGDDLADHGRTPIAERALNVDGAGATHQIVRDAQEFQVVIVADLGDARPLRVEPGEGGGGVGLGDAIEKAVFQVGEGPGSEGRLQRRVDENGVGIDRENGPEIVAAKRLKARSAARRDLHGMRLNIAGAIADVSERNAIAGVLRHDARPTRGHHHLMGSSGERGERYGGRAPKALSDRGAVHPDIEALKALRADVIHGYLRSAAGDDQARVSSGLPNRLPQASQGPAGV